MGELARSVGRDLRHGIRLWWGCPGVSLVSLTSLMLSISIGAATAVFTFFDVLLLRPLPVRAPAELYAVGPTTPANLDLVPVVNYAVARRTRELAVRLALGALPRDVFSAVLQRTLRLALGGIALGLPAAFACTRLLGGFLFGITGGDPQTLLLAAVALAVLALAAGYLPARRAVRVDPLAALRHE